MITELNPIFRQLNPV